MRIQGVKEIQERRLFHGTDIKNVDSICKYNFDLRLAGQHGHTWGKGELDGGGVSVQSFQCKADKLNVGLRRCFFFF